MEEELKILSMLLGWLWRIKLLKMREKVISGKWTPVLIINAKEISSLRDDSSEEKKISVVEWEDNLIHELFLERKHNWNNGSF